MISLSKACATGLLRLLKAFHLVTCTAGVYRFTNTGQIYNYPIIHYFHKKAKPDLYLFHYFLFCPDYTRIFQKFIEFFINFDECRPKFYPLAISPNVILAPCLRDPAQLIGCYQLLEVMHTFPQHLALVRIFHEDAMIFSL